MLILLSYRSMGSVIDLKLEGRCRWCADVRTVAVWAHFFLHRNLFCRSRKCKRTFLPTAYYALNSKYILVIYILNNCLRKDVMISVSAKMARTERNYINDATRQPDRRFSPSLAFNHYLAHIPQIELLATGTSAPSWKYQKRKVRKQPQPGRIDAD
jgi:hypothetical protein